MSLFRGSRVGLRPNSDNVTKYTLFLFWSLPLGFIVDGLRRSFFACCRLRPSVTLPEHFYCPSTAREAVLSQQRDIPAYNKYVLTGETREALKTPQFDVWQWEPNEMLSLLEEMYHELGLVEELDIHTSTLKRYHYLWGSKIFLCNFWFGFPFGNPNPSPRFLTDDDKNKMCWNCAVCCLYLRYTTCDKMIKIVYVEFCSIPF